MNKHKLSLKIRFHLKFRSEVETLILIHFNIGFVTSPTMQDWSMEEIQAWVKNQSKVKQRYHPVVISSGMKVITANWNQAAQMVAGNPEVNTRLDYIRDLGNKIFAELIKENDVIIEPSKFRKLFNERYIPSNSVNLIPVAFQKNKRKREFDPALLPGDMTIVDAIKQEKKSKEAIKVERILATKFTKYWMDKIKYWMEESTIDKESEKNYISSVNHWKEFEVDLYGGKEFIIAELDQELVREFAIYLTTKKSKRKKYEEEFDGMRLGTLSKHKTRLKKIIKEIQVEDSVKLGIETGVKILSKKTEKTEAIALSEEEIQKIYKADFSSIENPAGYRGSIGFENHKDELEFYRNCFLLGIVAGGCRVSDLKQLKDIRKIGNNKFKLVYKSEKTNFDVDMIIPEFFLVIFKKVKDKLSLLQDAKYNKLLKIIGLKSGLTDTIYLHITNPATGKVHPGLIKPIYALLGSHTARRTFISLMYSKGMQPIDIMALAGLDNIATLENYIKPQRQTIEAAAINFEGK